MASGDQKATYCSEARPKESRLQGAGRDRNTSPQEHHCGSAALASHAYCVYVVHKGIM